MARVLVLGAGMAGCTAAYLLARRGHEVTIIEAERRPGGGVRTSWYGGHPHTFGPRVFFSRDQEVIDQLTSLVEIREFETRTWTYVEADGALYHYPLFAGDLPQMPDWPAIRAELDERKGQTPRVDDFEHYWLDAVGPTLYRKFVDRYSRKMWGVESNRQLGADFEWVNRGTPIREADTRLYADQFQGYPSAPDGYNGYFERCLANCETVFSCEVKRLDTSALSVSTNKGEFSADAIVNTIHVDTLFDYEYGRLRWCGRTFVKLVLPVEQAMPDDVTWIHYSGDEPYTRVTEFKKITGHQAGDTLIGIEFPSDQGRFYPVQSEVERLRYDRYRALFPERFFSIGRLGSFRYKGIPDAIRDALDVAAELA
jgi:UDP-galactopyranose mutase